MNEIAKILFIVNGYPSPAEPTQGVFVKQIVDSIARQGVYCLVVQPLPLPKSLDRSGYPFHAISQMAKHGVVEVVRPSYCSVPMVAWGAKYGVLNPNRLKFFAFIRVILHTVRQFKFVPDAVYGHFLYFGGGAAIELGKQFGVPSFIGVGEGEFWSIKPFGHKFARIHLSGATGLIPNANHLLRKLGLEFDIPQIKMRSIPNGVDLNVFKPHDRLEARRELSLPPDLFIVCGVGNFLHKKGLVRVGQAIEGLKGVVGIFAGSGSEPPVGKNILWAKQVSHDQLPMMLSACDVFVLPTLIEGCCNAIIEAMACGLPIISSNTEYTEDLLNDECSIRVDPLDVGAIRAAIIELRDNDDLRKKMSDSALKHAQGFDIDVRAKRVLAFMEKMASGGSPNDQK